MKRSPRVSAILIRLTLIGAFALSAACTAPPTPRARVRMQLVGSDSMQWIAQALADAYTQSHSWVTLTVRTSNSQVGIGATREMSGTFGLVSRTIKASELEQARAVVVARDGIAIIVHQTNPINTIMRSQVPQVFSGEIAVWPLGPQTGKPIVVVSREDGSGTRDAFEKMVMNGTRVTRTAIVMPSEAAVVDYVARNANAVSYVSMGALTSEVRALTVDDVPLSPQTVESQKYPFVRTLSLIVPASADVEMQDFLNYVIGNEGQRVIGQKYGRAP